MLLTSEKLTKLISEKGCIIIAEACDNHFGSLDRAKKMIISAANAGADIIIPDCSFIFGLVCIYRCYQSFPR